MYDKYIFCGLPVAKTIIVPNETPDMPETTSEGTDVTKDSKLSTTWAVIRDLKISCNYRYR